jgi:acetolactate synthase-1/2/3 large subunit
MGNSMHVPNGAEAFINSLNAHGVGHLFLNPGIDIVPIQGTIATYRARGKQAPKVILCTHESVAVAAAHGFAMVSGRPQVVTVFQDVGTLQGGGAIVNLKYGRMPVLLCAGRNSTPHRINWLKEPCDQRRIARDYVKWDHEVDIDENFSSVLQQAFHIAGTEPCGPVYLSVPPEVITGWIGERNVSAPIQSGRAFPSEMDTEALRQAAEMLIDSENPLILTAYSGRHPQSVTPLVELAETLGARVMTTDLRMNFPSTHPLCPGIDSSRGDDYDHYIAEADVLLLIDYDFPGPMEKRVAPRPEARIIHMDIEPLKRGKPLWGRLPNILMEADSSKLLPLLNEIIRQRLRDEPDPRFRDRFGQMEEEHRQLRDKWRALAEREADQRPISAEWLCHCINEIADEDAIIVHMIPSDAESLSHQIGRTKPGTLFSWGDSAGSMGWPLGASLGAKLAAPDKMVISLIGDGGFMYGCPVAALWAANAHKAPFLTIIFNNQSYYSIKELIRMDYGESSVSGEKGFEVGTDIRVPPDYALVAKSCGAYGETVDDPSDLLTALQNGVDQVRRGKAAVIDVRLRDRRSGLKQTR